MTKKAVINKEETSENWCFICKDGGDLLICDYEGCPKSYHSSCLEKDDSFLENDKYWACAWHTCYKCHNCSCFHCYTCPHAACRRCLSEDFLQVKGRYGFCSSCVYLVLLIEGKKECDSDGEKVDFRDWETCEGLFMDYYIIVKEKEGFELGDLLAEEYGLKIKYESKSDSEEIDEEENWISNYGGAEHLRKLRRTCNEKRSWRKKYGMQTAMKSNINHFIGWGSRPLIEFLSSIGKSTADKLSRRDVTSIVNDYVKENKLLHPEKRKMIVCDIALSSLFKKKTFSKHRVYELLEAHFAENYYKSVEDEVGYDPEDYNVAIPDVCKTRRNLNLERKSQEKDLADNVLPGCFASIVAENVKLVYLRRSVILEMLKQPKTFEEKVVGCFVRVKTDRSESRSRNYYQLMKVRGVRRISSDENDMEAFLSFAAVPEEISTSLLSDDDFSEEECEDLRGRILDGQLERPTVEDLQQKANILHEDITKHRISKELALLRNLIDQANEKGWRSELFEYRKKQRTLQNPSDVLKMLENVPDVIPDLYDLNPNFEDIVNDKSSEDDSPKSILVHNSSIVNDGCLDHKASEEKTCDYNASEEPSGKASELRNIEAEGETRSSHKCIESIDGLDNKMWYLQTPNGECNKYSLSVLKEWGESSACASKFKVWKEGENENEAIWLHQLLSISFPKK